MGKSGGVGIRGMMFKEMIKRSAFAKCEENILKKCVVLVEEISKTKAPFLLIGGIPLRIYTSPKFQRRFGSGSNEITDIDIVFSKIPSEIKHCLQEEPLVEKEAVYMDWGGIRREKVISNTGTVFHLKKGCEKKLFADVCFFERCVGKIKVSDQDFKEVEVLYINANEKTVSFPLADLGLLIATCINPDALTDQRMRRCLLALLSKMEEEKKAGEYMLNVLNKTINKMLQAKYSESDIFDVTKKFVEKSRIFCEKKTAKMIYDIASKLIKQYFSTPLPPIFL